MLAALLEDVVQRIHPGAKSAPAADGVPAVSEISLSIFADVRDYDPQNASWLEIAPPFGAEIWALAARLKMLEVVFRVNAVARQ
jgi:hypothetical protein